VSNRPESRQSSKKRIWIDLDNSPHIPFFMPIKRELEQRGYDVVLTAWDAYQVSELVDFHGLKCRKIGRHLGKNKLLKVVGVVSRALHLVPFLIKERPSLAVSHGSRAQIPCGESISPHLCPSERNCSCRLTCLGRPLFELLCKRYKTVRVDIAPPTSHDQSGQDYQEILSSHGQLKFLPVNYFPGTIGGLWLMPHIQILNKFGHSMVLEAIQASNYGARRSKKRASDWRYCRSRTNHPRLPKESHNMCASGADFHAPLPPKLLPYVPW
jgi:hypothetical protein